MPSTNVGLGLSRRFRYEKRREEWDFEGSVIALDETPIGNFVEVEGDPVAIRRTVVALGLDVAGLMTNDQAWCDTVATAARAVGDPAWQLPITHGLPSASGCRLMTFSMNWASARAICD